MTTIPADYLFMIIVGLVFAWGASVQIQRSGSIFLNRYFLGALVFQSLFCMPLAIYCYVVFPDWCWMYWADAGDVPLALVISAFAGYYLMMAAGFWLGCWAEKRKIGLGGRILVYAVILLAAFCILTWRRLFFVGDLEAFRTGDIPSILDRTLLTGLLVPGFAAAFLALGFILCRFGRELNRPWSPGDQRAFEQRRRKVSLIRVEGDLAGALRDSLVQWDGLDHLGRLITEKGPRVILKPNFSGGGKDRAGTQTAAAVIGAVADLVREIDPGAEIVVAESGSILWHDVDRLLDGSVYEQLFEERGIRFENLSRGEKVMHDFGGRMGLEEMPAILDRPHVLIDLPVAKTHSFFLMSGALKNLFGLTPAPHKLARYHTRGFADFYGRIFIDIYRSYPPDLVVLDGTTSCEGNGPVGTPRRTDFLITSDDALCVDFVLAGIMGIEPEEVPYLKVLLEDGFEPRYDLLGATVEAVRPGSWKRPLRPGGLTVNFLRILGDHVRDRVRGG
ncbi:DUF362 domain-containing protein [Thermodesulfobacteriota bacterium]